MKNLYLIIFLLSATYSYSQTIIPQKTIGSKFAMYVGNLYFEIDSARGARFTSFKLDDNELMYDNFAKTDMAGSTFWPSPQSVWNWPPAVNLDSKPYKTSIIGNKMVFSGSTDSKSSLRFHKSIIGNPADTSIVIDYCIKNEKATTQKWAPWEITRVLNNGITVFAKGSGNVSGNMTGRTKDLSGYIWYDQANTKGLPGEKFFCDGKGWLAHVEDGYKLFIKKFEDVPTGSAAPAEAEVEVYTNPDKTYTELENQGIYASIAGKDSITWRVKWYARIIPEKIDVSIGSAALTNYIESVLKREALITTANNIKQTSVKVFPNPASDQLSIELNSALNNPATLRIVDLQGRIVFYQPINQVSEKINISNLNQGNYIYDLTLEKASVKRGIISIYR